MQEVHPNFSQEQWEFLAVLDAIKEPVTMHVVGSLAPVPPGPLFDLLNQAKKLEWIIQEGEEHFAIGSNLTLDAQKQIDAINTPQRLSVVADKLNLLNLEQRACSDKSLANLLQQAGRNKEAGELYSTLALKFWEDQDHNTAWEYVSKATACLCECLSEELDRDCQTLYTTAVLRLSQLSLILGKGLGDLPKHLYRARKTAQKFGDRRSCALLNMHIGRLNYFSNRHQEAIELLSSALKEVEELGDEEIRSESADFIGLYYFMQGLHKDAVEYLDRAELYATAHNHFYDPYTPIFQGSSLIFLGDFHRAIGNLDTNWRNARERGDQALAAILEGILSIALQHINKEQEAAQHLTSAVEQAEACDNAIALRVCRGAQALQALNNGDTDKARELLDSTFPEGGFSGLRFYSAPWILEMLFEFEHLGATPLSNVSFAQELDTLLSGENVHLKGVILRLKAKQRLDQGESSDSVAEDLQQSLAYLQRSGDPLQQSKTLFELARLNLANDYREQAIQRARSAWKLLGGYAEYFFPDDLRALIEVELDSSADKTDEQSGLRRYLEALEGSLLPEINEDIYSRLLIATNRYFGSERGGLFWFKDGRFTTKPKLKAACNLSEGNLSSERFKPSLDLVLKTFQDTKPAIVRAADQRKSLPVKAMLCLPLSIKGKITAILYHDNSYLEDCFDFLDKSTLNDLVRHFSAQLAQIWEFSQIKESRDNLRTQASISEDEPNDKGITFKSQAMESLMTKVDKIATSDSTVMLLGETGVGKELTARRLHEKSPRKDKPFVVIDSTTIPENLFESELFGHEKGSFTGADKQRKGRIELADGGTLFIDEVGELPLNVQSKLLRALQERSFQRVGGTSVIKSDFRLVAATNRDMAAEVEAGNFREDLYYRLNVIPIKIPPLRERGEDIVLLAQHFLDRFSKRYQGQRLVIDTQAKKQLTNYHWPGNVRELENTMERAALLSSEGYLEIDLPTGTSHDSNDVFADNPTLEEVQRRYIEYVLKRTNGKISGPGGAAEWLGLPRSTLLGRMRKLGMQGS